MDALLVAPALLRGHEVAEQQRVDGGRDVGVDEDLLAILDLDDDVERRRRLALEDALLRAAATRLLVAQGHALDAADQVRQRRVEHQVVEVVAVRGADQLHAALGDRARRLRLELGADLVDDDDLGHVVLDRLDHHLVLQARRPDLHPPGLSDRRMRDVSVAGDLVRGVDDDDPLALLVGEHAGGLPEHGGLADARATHDQDRLPGLDVVRDDLDRAVDRAPDAAGQPDDLAVAVADRRDPVEGALDARAVVVAERPDVLDDVGDVAVADLAIEQRGLGRGVARLRPAAEVQDDLDQRLPVRQGVDRLHDLRRQRRQEHVEVVHGLALALGGSHADRPSFVVGHLDVVLRHRTPAGTRRGSATLTRVSFISSVTVAIEAKPSSSRRRSIGDS